MQLKVHRLTHLGRCEVAVIAWRVVLLRGLLHGRIHADQGVKLQRLLALLLIDHALRTAAAASAFVESAAAVAAAATAASSLASGSV